MSDQLPGGAPAFEEPDFTKFGGAENDTDLDIEDELDDLEDDDSDDIEEAVAEDEDDEEEEDEEEDEDVSSVQHIGQSEVAEADANSSEGGTARAVLEHLARSIVDDKESVVIETKVVRGQLRLYLHVAQGDMGRIIGRRGRTAQAVRTLVRAAAAAESNDVFVEIVD